MLTSNGNFTDPFAPSRCRRRHIEGSRPDSASRRIEGVCRNSSDWRQYMTKEEAGAAPGYVCLLIFYNRWSRTPGIHDRRARPQIGGLWAISMLRGSAGFGLPCRHCYPLLNFSYPHRQGWWKGTSTGDGRQSNVLPSAPPLGPQTSLAKPSSPLYENGTTDRRQSQAEGSPDAFSLRSCTKCVT